ncbi:Membrane-bound lytic murein transglycosylase [Legionella nautarum]|uniref:Membrane-bound lytic murein transglycosylase A n=1 Tax=Legionella nautarum TaxID=45070 RepID=A0A0W0WV13_9GAMM|nr:murein transglycosylase A [Legionella nautarum]KTD36153.1 Membrane-bound lytic murein transglycosylase [Legionella nautarum]
MKRKLLLLTFIPLLTLLGVFSWWYWSKQPKAVQLKQRSFAQLPGWKTTKVRKSLQTFQISCKAFLNQDPEQRVGSQHIALKAKDWQPACRAALAINPITETAARKFFQKWFTPVEFNDNQPVRGLFTGYYMAELHGSRTKSKEYNVPIYGMPTNLVSINLGLFDPSLKNRRMVGRVEGNQILPYYTRAEINNGAINQKAPVLLWVNSDIDRLFLEIQGSGTVVLDDGSRVHLGYAAENGAPYTSVARILIDQGVMTRDNASMQHIKRYLEANPDQMHKVLNKNKSFVFFHYLKDDSALGSQGVALTPGYSLAIDKKWIPMGAPLWLNTTRPAEINPDQDKAFQRLMIAQDTGGAIKGLVRGDVFWGGGEKATFIAGHMKNPGHYWLLLPNHTVERLKKEFT